MMMTMIMMTTMTIYGNDDTIIIIIIKIIIIIITINFLRNLSQRITPVTGNISETLFLFQHLYVGVQYFNRFLYTKACFADMLVDSDA